MSKTFRTWRDHPGIQQKHLRGSRDIQRRTVMHMHLRAKMGAAIITLGAMLLLCGAVGYLGTQKLSDSLSFVTTKAWDAADGTMEGTIGIQRELLAVAALVNIHQPNAAERMQLLNDIGEAKRFAAEALSRAKQSGLLPNEQIAVLDRSLEAEERLQRRRERPLARYRRR